MNRGPLQPLYDAVRRTRALTRHRSATGAAHDAADESLGTFATDGALGFDPFVLLRALHRAGARAVVVGQVAGILHGSDELTGDLDLLWDGDPAQAEALAAAVAAVGGSLADERGEPLAVEARSFLRPKVQFASPQASGDVCGPDLPWGGLPLRDILGRALVAGDPEGFEVRYVGREDLILMRRAIGRPKDLRRADELERLGGADRPPAPSPQPGEQPGERPGERPGDGPPCSHVGLVSHGFRAVTNTVSDTCIDAASAGYSGIN